MWWLFAAGTALAIAPADVPNPRVHGGWVTDVARVLEPSEVAAMDAIVDGLHRELGVEIAVVVVDSTDDLTPKEFTTELFSHWGIGRRGVDNGLLVSLVISARRLEMETGYGLEAVLPDAWLGAMQAERMVPHFRAEDYGAGLLAGLAATADRLRAHPLEAQLGSRIHELETEPWPEPPPDRRGSPVSWDVALLGVLGGVVGTVGGGSALVLHRRRRTCPKCRVYMPMVDEEADDAWLTDGQRQEEILGSVDHRIHLCPVCEDVRVFRRVRWWTGWQQCPKCHHRTRASTRTTIQAATTTRAGKARVDDTCRACGYHATRYVVIPRIERSSGSSSGSSSSSRSGGSFGGGRSGGGGAGSSW